MKYFSPEHYDYIMTCAQMADMSIRTSKCQAVQFLYDMMSAVSKYKSDILRGDQFSVSTYGSKSIDVRLTHSDTDCYTTLYVRTKDKQFSDLTFPSSHTYILRIADNLSSIEITQKASVIGTRSIYISHTSPHTITICKEKAKFSRQHFAHMEENAESCVINRLDTTTEMDRLLHTHDEQYELLQLARQNEFASTPALV